MTLSISTDRQLIRAAARSNRYVLVNFTAPAAPRRDARKPVNVAFVLDRSGSMSDENKFHLARQAVEQALRMLKPEDRFAIVVYDERIDVIARSSHATSSAIRKALDALSSVHPRGSTDLFTGWMNGCNEVAEFADHEQISRVLLLTDGLANHGITDRTQLAHHASELRQRGVSTSTFGVGADFDERLLQGMAQDGGGNFYFLERADQIIDLLTSELGEALEVVMPRAAIELEIPPHGDAELLSRYRSSVVDNILRIELGDVVSSQEVELVVRMNFPRGDEGARASTRAHLHGGASAIVSNELEWTYASHQANDVQQRNRKVDRCVAEIYAARARADAIEANRVGDFDAARRVIMKTAERIRKYAGNDAELRRISQRLEAERPRYDEAVMSPMLMKQAYYQADMASKGRVADGKARRSPR
jgi:Ca-activated chloride channel family protein